MAVAKTATSNSSGFLINRQTGFLRLSDILSPKGPIPVSRSTWWAGVKSGRYPKPVKLGPRITAWRAEDIARLIETGVE
jgi:prophage regulatory protein